MNKLESHMENAEAAFSLGSIVPVLNIAAGSMKTHPILLEPKWRQINIQLDIII